MRTSLRRWAVTKKINTYDSQNTRFILVKGYFVTVIRKAFFSEAISLKSIDCFGKKRLAMTHILTRNEYKMKRGKSLFSRLFPLQLKSLVGVGELSSQRFSFHKS
jgi:hypothetical protein